MLRRWQLAHVERPSHFSFRPVAQGSEWDVRPQWIIWNKDARTPAELTSHRRPARDLRLYALALSVGVVSAGDLHLGQDRAVSFGMRQADAQTTHLGRVHDELRLTRRLLGWIEQRTGSGG